MKKNLYFRTVFRRENKFKKFIYDIFLTLAVFFRVPIEVFTRRNFGERYFSLSTTIVIALLLLAYPAVINGGFSMDSGFSSRYYRSRGESEPTFLGTYALWYVFTGLFIYCGYLRWREIKRNPSTFDFGRFSLSTGDVVPLLSNLKIGNKPLSIRAIETIAEPLLFFIPGVVLFLVHQDIGLVIAICSIVYSISYFAAYAAGDNFVLDTIDEMILNDEQNKAFVQNENTDKTKGVRFYSRKPTSEELRERVADSFIVDQKEEETFAL